MTVLTLIDILFDRMYSSWLNAKNEGMSYKKCLEQAMLEVNLDSRCQLYEYNTGIQQALDKELKRQFREYRKYRMENFRRLSDKIFVKGLKKQQNVRFELHT